MLVTIGFACSFLPLLFLWLIPSRKEIDELQESMKKETLAKGAGEGDDVSDNSDNCEDEEQ